MPNNHGFSIPNEQGMAQQAQREMQARVKDKPLKKIYGIELTEEQETFLKTRFKCQTDANLRNILQRIAVSLINQQRDSIIEEKK